MPSFLKLTRLDLSFTLLDLKSLAKLPAATPALTTLKLAGTGLRNVAQLHPLARPAAGLAGGLGQGLSCLSFITLAPCPLVDANRTGYRAAVFALLTQLSAVDGFTSSGDDVEAFPESELEEREASDSGEEDDEAWRTAEAAAVSSEQALAAAGLAAEREKQEVER